MIERFLRHTSFTSHDDFRRNLQFIMPENFNFAYDVMDVWAEEAPDRTALLWTDDNGECVRLSFKDIREQSDKAAKYLRSTGIGKGDKVMLMLKQRREFWPALLALHKLGAVAIPASHTLASRDIACRSARADIKAIICTGEGHVADRVKESAAASPGVKTLISVGPEVPKGFRDWHAEWELTAADSAPEKANTGDDTMLIYFTGGTDGEPKMVAHDFMYAFGHLTTGLFWHHLGPGSTHLTVGDSSEATAARGTLYGQWFAGATVMAYAHDKLCTDKLLRLIERHHITSLCAPPAVYRLLVREDFSSYDITSLRHCCTTGEGLNPAVYDKFYRLTGIRLMEGYAQAETAMALATMPWMKPKPGSMGQPNPQYDIALLRPDGTPCEDGEEGEIVIRTGRGKPLGLFKGYYRDDELTGRAWHDGVYHTGDLAWRDEDGYYRFVGRSSDMITSSGYRIGPFEVENALMTHPAVVECAVTGVADSTRGMAVKATVVVGKEWKDSHADSLAGELQSHVRRLTAPYKCPRIIEFAEELPKTAGGMINRAAIREKDSTR